MDSLPKKKISFMSKYKAVKKPRLSVLECTKRLREKKKHLKGKFSKKERKNKYIYKEEDWKIERGITLTVVLEFGLISLLLPTWEKLSMSMTKLSDFSVVY